jgi:uncharacterized protein
MRGGFPMFVFIVLAIILLIDLYAFRGIRILVSSLQPVWRSTIILLYWSIPFVIFCIVIYSSLNLREVITTKSFRIWYFMMGLLMAVYIPKLVFIVFQFGNDLVRLVGFTVSKVSAVDSGISGTASTMTRSEFLTKLGIVIAVIPFVSIIHGIARGRFNYQIKNLKLIFRNLPKPFHGLKVLQISDWHIGSFFGQKEKVKESIELINQQKADIILFTGDFVNNVAEELEPFVHIVSQIKAPFGVYSILGNHDYGEYVSWKSEAEHEENMQKLFTYQANAGFRLLRNDSVIIEKEGEKIGIAGVENWGLPPFPQYGNINKALENISNLPFKIVMSHDPSHWDAEIVGKTNTDLTLSGHTHGMQFGINLPGIKWSPVQWKYPRWNGLYQVDNQYLYVNVGIGYIAFPGRVGFLPEITVFELNCET